MGDMVIYEENLSKEDIFSSIEKSISISKNIINRIKENDVLVKNERDC